MANVVLSPTAVADLERMIETHSLPESTRSRVASVLGVLATFPQIGAPLHGRWAGYRFLLGPWRWMIVVYVVDERNDAVGIATIQDSRSARAATAADAAVRSRSQRARGTR